MRDYIYCYSNGVLVNRFNICDQKELDTVESNITSVKLVQADKLEKIFRDNGFTFNGLKALYRYLFEDIYYWAGCTRRIDIEKPERVLNGLSVQYSHHKNIANTICCCNMVSPLYVVLLRNSGINISPFAYLCFLCSLFFLC